MTLLEIRNLSVEYHRKRSPVRALRNVSLSLPAGKTLGIVGESGCGKSTLAHSILRLVQPHEGAFRGGEILFEGRDLLKIPEAEMRALRGREIGMIFQDPFSSLNPVLRVGRQIEEAIRAHDPAAEGEPLRARVIALLRQCAFDDPERIHHSYPHQISGGQRQRAMIAMAISNHPRLLIADEPTTALDVSIQKEILELLVRLQKELEMTILLVTHHLGVIARYSEELAVLYAGEIVEQGRTAEVISRPQHPYTQALLKSMPGKAAGRRGRLHAIGGAPPDPARLPAGCAFHPRCPAAVERCKTEAPILRALGDPARKASCHLAPFES